MSLFLGSQRKEKWKSDPKGENLLRVRKCHTSAVREPLEFFLFYCFSFIETRYGQVSFGQREIKAQQRQGK
jgi:hypothetical protein